MSTKFNLLQALTGCDTLNLNLKYHIQLKLETLQGHVTFLIPEKQLAECLLWWYTNNLLSICDN